jgi:hypothetical protein
MSDYRSEKEVPIKKSKDQINEAQIEMRKIAMQGFAPLSDETRMDLYEIQNMPADERGAAFSEYNMKAIEKEYIQLNSCVDAHQTKIMDPKTGQWIIVRDDDPIQNE